MDTLSKVTSSLFAQARVAATVAQVSTRLCAALL